MKNINYDYGNDCHGYGEMMIVKRQVYEFGIESFEDDGVVVLKSTTGDHSREGVDEWIRLAGEIFDSAASKPVLCMLNDTSHPNSTATPYSREKMTAFSDNWDGAGTIYVALLMPDKFHWSLASIIARKRGGKRKNVMYRVFTNRDKAMTWLRQYMR